MIKWSIQQENIKISSIHVLNMETPEYIKQTLTNVKGEIGSNTIIGGDLNNPLHSFIHYHWVARRVQQIQINQHDTSHEHNEG